MIAALHKNIISSSTDVPAVLMIDIKLKQTKYRPPASVSTEDHGVYRKNWRIWNPNGAPNQKLLIAIYSHCGKRPQSLHLGNRYGRPRVFVGGYEKSYQEVHLIMYPLRHLHERQESTSSISNYVTW